MEDWEDLFRAASGETTRNSPYLGKNDGPDISESETATKPLETRNKKKKKKDPRKRSRRADDEADYKDAANADADEDAQLEAGTRFLASRMELPPESLQEAFGREMHDEVLQSERNSDNDNDSCESQRMGAYNVLWGWKLGGNMILLNNNTKKKKNKRPRRNLNHLSNSSCQEFQFSPRSNGRHHDSFATSSCETCGMSPLLHRLALSIEYEEGTHNEVVSNYGSRISTSTGWLRLFASVRNVRSLASYVSSWRQQRYPSHDKVQDKNDTNVEENYKDTKQHSTVNSIFSEQKDIEQLCAQTAMTIATHSDQQQSPTHDSDSRLQEKLHKWVVAVRQWYHHANANADHEIKKRNNQPWLSCFEARTHVLVTSDDVYHWLYYQFLVSLANHNQNNCTNNRLTEFIMAKVHEHSEKGNKSTETRDNKKTKKKWRVVPIPHPHVYFALPGLAWQGVGFHHYHYNKKYHPNHKKDQQVADFIKDLDPFSLLHACRQAETRSHFGANSDSGSNPSWAKSKQTMQGHLHAVQQRHVRLQTLQTQTKTQRNYSQCNKLDEYLEELGSTPAHPTLIEWRRSTRDFATHLYGYAAIEPVRLRDMVKVVRSILRGDKSGEGKSEKGMKNNPVEIVEVGAGTGYLAKVLQRLKGVGVVVEPYDVSPLQYPREADCDKNSAASAEMDRHCHRSQNNGEGRRNAQLQQQQDQHEQNEYHGATPAFLWVEEGSVKTSLQRSMMRPTPESDVDGNHDNGTKRKKEKKKKKEGKQPQDNQPTKNQNPKALLLCYPPPPSANQGVDMALQAVQHYFQEFKGRCLIYVGEFGIGRLTGSAGFETLLGTWMQQGVLERVFYEPCLSWGTDASFVTVWKRTGNMSKNNLSIPKRLDCGLMLCFACLDENKNQQQREVKREETMPATAKVRCVLARSLAYCSRRCFQRDKVRRQRYLEEECAVFVSENMRYEDERLVQKL